MRVMAVDFGDARTGLAVSDISGLICADAWTIEEWNFERAADRISAAAKEREAGLLILGLPKNMDGTEGARAQKSRELKALLEEKSGLEVKLWDERLRGHENARAASFATFACRDELALIVFVFRASHSSLAERGSDSIAPGRQSQLCCYFALAQAPLTPLALPHTPPRR